MNLWLHVFTDAVITKHSLSLSSVRECSAGDELSPAALSRIALISTTNACCYGTSKPRGPLAVMIRHLKILGYDCVLVRLARFKFFSQNTQFTEMSSYLLFCRSRIRSSSPCLSKTRQTF